MGDSASLSLPKKANAWSPWKKCLEPVGYSAESKPHYHNKLILAKDGEGEVEIRHDKIHAFKRFSTEKFNDKLYLNDEAIKKLKQIPFKRFINFTEVILSIFRACSIDLKKATPNLERFEKEAPELIDKLLKGTFDRDGYEATYIKSSLRPSEKPQCIKNEKLPSKTPRPTDSALVDGDNKRRRLGGII